MQLDANGRAITGSLPFVVSKRITFDGGTANDPGDFNGTGNPTTLFIVTGDVLVHVLAISKTDLVGAATLGAGVADSTGALLGPINDASTFLSHKSFAAAGGVADVGEFNPTGSSPYIIGGGQDIIQTVGTADITAGVVDYYCFWRPLSSDGSVVGA